MRKTQPPCTKYWICMQATIRELPWRWTWQHVTACQRLPCLFAPQLKQPPQNIPPEKYWIKDHQSPLDQPSLSKASRLSFAFSFLTPKTGREWLTRCSSRTTSPPGQLCSHSGENTRSNKKSESLTPEKNSCTKILFSNEKLVENLWFPSLNVPP